MLGRLPDRMLLCRTTVVNEVVSTISDGIVPFNVLFESDSDNNGKVNNCGGMVDTRLLLSRDKFCN